MTPATFAIEVLFAAVFVGAVVQFVRRRDPLAGDVALVFSGLVVVFVAGLVGPYVGPLRQVLQSAGIILLLAQPFLTLRLVGRLRSLPSWLLPGALIGLVVTAVPFVALSLVDPEAGLVRPLVLAAVAVFVVTELLAAAYLIAEARLRVGSARVRLAVAALATAGLAVAILAAGAAASANGGGAGAGLTQLVALLSALAYVVAFLPPTWLRRLWQAEAAYLHGQQLMAAPASEDEPAIWGRLVAAAARIAGSDASVLVLLTPGEPPRVGAVAGPLAARIGSIDGNGPEDALHLGTAAIQRIHPATAPIRHRLGEPIGARYSSMVTFPVDAVRTATLVNLSRHASLFGGDDTVLLGSLGRIAALLVERRAVLAEQEELAERLTATVAALGAASEAKSDFVASMSHELRTPLTAIIGFSDLMRTTPHDGDSILVPAEWVEHIHRSGQHLLGLINDVLDLAKVEAGRLDLSFERLELKTAVLESVAGLRPLADRKAITIETDVPSISIDVDRGRLRQILYNLLSNAIKYTLDGGRIIIDARQVDGDISLAVQDTGVGISPDDLLHVFEEFRQVGDVATRQPGTGLGLALCRRLVEAHGGRIDAASTPGEGSRFTVYLPATREAAEAVPTAGVHPPATVEPEAGPVAGTRAAALGPEVLVIEDDPSAVRLLRTFLESDGYRARVASDGESGLEAARARHPDAIILDVLLSGIDGWEVLRRLKTDSALRDVPVIIVTIVDERELGLALGAVDYLVKPVDRAALTASLARYTSGVAHPGGIRVLAVDDDPAALDMIEAALRPEGHEVTRALSGAEGLAIARSTPLDLVICDILMPDLDGFGVVAALNGDERTHDLPILILTAHQLSEADRARLNGNILGIAAKGATGTEGLREWLQRTVGAGRVVPEAGGA